jgi:hypothetical protein
MRKLLVILNAILGDRSHGAHHNQLDLPRQSLTPFFCSIVGAGVKRFRRLFCHDYLSSYRQKALRKWPGRGIL